MSDDKTQSEYVIEVAAKVKIEETAPSRDIALHNAEQDFRFHVPGTPDDLEIINLEMVDGDD